MITIITFIITLFYDKFEPHDIENIYEQNLTIQLLYICIMYVYVPIKMRFKCVLHALNLEIKNYLVFINITFGKYRQTIL